MNIVIIGGGTGTSNLARGLRRIGTTLTHDVKAIVGMADSGGYSGVLRNEKGVLPPGDVMKLLLAFSTLPEEFISRTLYYRFPDGSIPGHINFVDLVERHDYMTAISYIEQWLECSGKVIPASLDDANLIAETNIRLIMGEGTIEHWFYEEKTKDWNKEKLLGVYLDPPCQILPAAVEAIRNADLIVIGPGSFYTSLIAVLCVKGMVEALASKRIAFVVNATTHPKETPGWRASDFVKELETQIRRHVDVVVCNEGMPKNMRELYRMEHSFPVRVDIPADWNGRTVITEQLILPDSESEKKLAQHDPTRLARVVESLLE